MGEALRAQARLNPAREPGRPDAEPAQFLTPKTGVISLGSDLAYIVETDTATLEKRAPSTESSCIADLTEPVQKEGLNGARVRFRAICTNAGDACSSPLRIDATQVNIGLQDLPRRRSRTSSCSTTKTSRAS